MVEPVRVEGREHVYVVRGPKHALKRATRLRVVGQDLDRGSIPYTQVAGQILATVFVADVMVFKQPVLVGVEALSHCWIDVAEKCLVNDGSDLAGCQGTNGSIVE